MELCQFMWTWLEWSSTVITDQVHSLLKLQKFRLKQTNVLFTYLQKFRNKKIACFKISWSRTKIATCTITDKEPKLQFAESWAHISQPSALSFGTTICKLQFGKRLLYYTVKSTRKPSSWQSSTTICKIQKPANYYEAIADQMTRPVVTHIWTQCCVFSS